MVIAMLLHNLLVILVTLFILFPPIHAEVILDGTLGQSGALPGPDYFIGADLGQQQGGNLFHSFQDFNLNSHESATFSGPESITNIISRVTGGNGSHINGLIRSTIPNADMYFINPYGIMFGEGASLDVQGSFYASTADTLRFSDGGEFNARDPDNSLLTVAPIESFGFLAADEISSGITLQDSKLSVPEGKTLSLIVGSNLIVNDINPISNNEKPTHAGVVVKDVVFADEKFFSGSDNYQITKINDVAVLGPYFQITSDLGRQYDDILFYSFRNFNIFQGERANFFRAADVRNIVSYVSGGKPSYIFVDTLRFTPNVAFIFLNPYGIMLGENSKLDVQGNLYIGTNAYIGESQTESVPVSLIEKTGAIAPIVYRPSSVPLPKIPTFEAIFSLPPFKADYFLKNRCEGLTRKDLNELIVIDRDVPPTTPDDQKTHYIRRPNAPKPVKPLHHSSVISEQLF